MSNAEMIAELTRAKVLFQARALAAALGVPQPTALPSPSLKSEIARLSGEVA